MTEVTVSISLTKKQQGELYMRAIKLEKQVRELKSQCHDIDARRAAAVRQSAALAAEIERISETISRLYAEGQDAVEM
jgi:chromosome segregation ATPase